VAAGRNPKSKVPNLNSCHPPLGPPPSHPPPSNHGHHRPPHPGPCHRSARPAIVAAGSSQPSRRPGTTPEPPENDTRTTPERVSERDPSAESETLVQRVKTAGSLLRSPFHREASPELAMLHGTSGHGGPRLQILLPAPCSSRSRGRPWPLVPGAIERHRGSCSVLHRISGHRGPRLQIPFPAPSGGTRGPAQKDPRSSRRPVDEQCRSSLPSRICGDSLRLLQPTKNALSRAAPQTPLRGDRSLPVAGRIRLVAAAG
jgi:hypothetical protein